MKIRRRKMQRKVERCTVKREDGDEGSERRERKPPVRTRERRPVLDDWLQERKGGTDDD